MKTLCWMLVLVALVIPSFAQAEDWDEVGPNGGWPNDMERDRADRIVVTGFRGVHRSSDAGESWEQILADTPEVYPRSVAINDAGHILLGCDGTQNGKGFVLSTDDGGSWQVLSNSLSFRVVIDLLVTPNQNVFACTAGNGLYYSTNHGTTFTSVAGVPSFLSCIESNENGDLFVGLQFNAVNIMGSIDGGLTWVPKDTGVDVDIMDLTRDPGSQFGMYGVGANKVFKTSDGGTGWTNMNAPQVFSYTGVAATADGNVYASNFAGISGGGGRAYSTANQGGSWTEMAGLSGYPVGQFLSFAPDWLFLEVTGPGPHRLGSDGNTWEPKSQGMHGGLITQVVPDEDGGRIFAVAEGLGIIASADAGLTWDLSFGIPWYEYIYSTIAGPGVMYTSGAYNGIYKSTNGVDWDPIFGLTATALAFNDQGNVYAGYGNRIYRTSDEGGNWPQVGMIPGVQSISDIACSGTQVFVATSNNGVYYSGNDGGSWSAINNGLTNLNTTSIAIDPDPEAACRVTVGTLGGIFDLDEQTTTWAYNTSSDEFVPGMDLRIRSAPYQRAAISEDIIGTIDEAAMCLYQQYSTPSSDYTDLITYVPGGLARGEPEFVQILGTYGFGLWRSDGTTSTGVDSMLPPSNEILLSVGRNPFQRSTTLEFDLARPSEVELEVFDATGRLVTTLLEGWREAGRHTVKWNAAGRASGVYFSRLSIGGEAQTKRLVLLR